MFGRKPLKEASAETTTGRPATPPPRRYRVIIGMIVVCLGVLLGAGSLVGVASAADDGTAIDSCQAINASGSYFLNTSLTSGSSACISINATDVDFDGHGESIENPDTAVKITATTNASNITVRNLTIRNAAEGVRTVVGSNATRNITVSNTTMEEVNRGFEVPTSTESTPRVEFAIRNSTINATSKAVNVLNGNVGQYGVELEDNLINTTTGDSGVRFAVTDSGTDLNVSMLGNTIESKKSGVSLKLTGNRSDLNLSMLNNTVGSNESGVSLNLERSHAITDLELRENEINVSGNLNDRAIGLDNSDSVSGVNMSIDVEATNNTLESTGTALFLNTLQSGEGSRDIEFANNTIEASDPDAKGYDVDATGENTSVNFTVLDNTIDSGYGQTLTLTDPNQTLDATFERNTITKRDELRDGIRIDAGGSQAPANLSVLNNTFTEPGSSLQVNLRRDNATMDVDIRRNDANDIMFVNFGGMNSQTDINATENTVNATGTAISLDEVSDDANQSIDIAVRDNIVNGTGGSQFSKIGVNPSAPDSTANITVTDNMFNKTGTNEGLLVNADGDDMTVDTEIANNTIPDSPDIAGIKTTVNGLNTTANVSVTNNTVDAEADAVSVFPRGDDQTIEIGFEDNDLNVTTTGSNRNGILIGRTDRNSTLDIFAADNTINSTGHGIDIDPGHGEGDEADPVDIDLGNNVINASTEGVIIEHVDTSERVTDRNVTVSMDDNIIEAAETGVEMNIENDYGTDNVTLTDNRIDVTDDSLSLTLDGGEMDLNLSATNNTLTGKNQNGARLILADPTAPGTSGTRDVTLSNNDVTAGDQAIYMEAERNGLTVNLTALENHVTSTDQYDPGILAAVSSDQMIVDADISENEIDVNGEGIDVELFSDNMNTTVTVSENVVNPGASTGVALRGGSGTAQNATWDVSDNSIDQAETGIFIENVKMRDAGSYDVSVQNNTVTDSSEVGLEIDSEVGSGASTQPGTVDVTKNNISSAATTVRINDDGGPVAGIDLSNNRFDANSWGVENLNTTAGYVNATDNYWGASDGPGSSGNLEDPVTGAGADGSGSNVTERGSGVSNVHFDPYLTSPPGISEPVDFDITVDSTNSPVTEGETLTVDATVENTGDQQGTQDVNLSVNGTERDSTSVTLDSDNTTSVSFNWSTGSGDAGSYSPTVESENDSDSTSVTVNAPSSPANFGITIDSTNSPVTEGETLTVDATVENTGDQQGTQDVNLSVNGTERDSTSVTLDSDNTTSVSFNWSTGSGDAGSYSPTVESENDSDSTSVTVNAPSSSANFSVQIPHLPSPTKTGNELNITANVTNSGTGAGTQNVTLEDFDGQRVDSRSVTLTPAESTDVSLTWQTETDDAGDDTVTVSSENDTATVNVSVYEGSPNRDPIAQNDSYVTQEETTLDVPASGGVLENDTDLDNDTMSVSLEEDASNGDLRLDSNGSFEYTPDQGFTGEDSFRYNVSDGEGGTDTATVTIETIDTGAPYIAAPTDSQYDPTNSFTIGVSHNATGVISPGDIAIRLVNITNGNGTVVGLNDSESIPEETLGSKTVNTTIPAGNLSGDVTIETRLYNVSNESVVATDTVTLTTTGEGGDGPITRNSFINGTVTDSNSNPVSDVEVFAVDENNASDSTIPNNDGEFSLNVPAGEYTIIVEGSNYEPQIITVEENDEEVVNLTVIENTTTNFNVSIDNTNAPVVEGDELQVTATIENPGDRSATEPIDLTVGDLTTQTEVTLDSGASTQETISVDTNSGDAGNYLATVSTEDDSDSTDVTVQSGANFAVSVDSTNAPVVEGDELLVNAEIENTGGTTATQSIELEAGELGTDSTSVELTPGESTTVTLSTQTNTGDTGDYTATVSTGDDSDSTDVTVQSGANFEVSVDSTNAPVVEGDELQVTATIENTGDASATQTIDLNASDLGTDSTTVELTGGESTDVELSTQTSSGDVGNYTVTVSTEDTSDSRDVAVTEPVTQPSFSVSTLDAPDEITTGEEAEITSSIENTGGRESTQAITLRINGNAETEENITLTPDESTLVTFGYTATEDDRSVIDVEVASANDTNSTTIAVTQPEETIFAIADIAAPTEAESGDTIDVTATIENIGNTGGSNEVVFLIDDGEEETRTVTLDSGENTTETFSYAISEDRTGDIEAIIESPDERESTEIAVNDPLGRVGLELTANQTEIVRGEAAEFTVTDETGTPIDDATVRLPDTTEETEADGTVVATIDTVGQLDIVATKAPTADREFAPATLGVSVSRPTLEIDQQTVSVGDVRVGDSAITALTVSNDAPTAIPIDTERVTGSDGDTFTLDSTLPAELPANTDRTVNVSFAPQTAGSAEATLRVNEQTVTLSGTGTAPDLNVETELPIELTTDPGTTATTAVTVSNDGNAPLTADLSSGDRFTQPEELTVNAGATETFDVEFTPQDSDGASVSTRLTVAPESESLSPTTIPLVGTVIDREISLQTDSVTLGNATVGETTTAGVVVDNPGTTTETLTATTDTSAFEVAPEDTEVTLVPGDQAFLSIEATPTEPGEITDSLTVETDDGAVSDTATLTAVGQAPDVDIGTDSVAFGTTPLNSTTTRAVEVTNEGDALLTVDVDETLDDSPFTPVGETQLRIPAGESRSLPVGFTPQTAGETTADLTLTTNDPETQQTTIELTGEGVETNVGLSPSTVSFGTVGVSTSTTETVTLANDGSSFTIDEVTVDDTAFTADADLDGTTVAEDETVELDLVFDPTTDGSQTGTVTVSGSTDTDNTDVSAALTGTGQTGDLEVSSQTLRTGVTVADETTTGSISIENTGLPSTQLSIDEVTLNDTDQFSLSEDGLTAGATIAGGTQQPVVVAFEPTSPDDGVAETTLTLEASSGEQTFTRTISVTGIVSAPEPTVSTETLAVGTIPVSDTNERTVTVANEGGEPFSIESVDSGAEGVTAQRLGSSEVVPGDERTIAVAVNQSTAGTIDTTVDITTTAAGDPSVDVTGEVVAPEFSIATESVGFDETSTGSAAQQTVTIDNTGAAPLTVASPTISGPDSPAFSILSGDQRLRISANSSETITLGFAPDTTGEQTATLAIEPGNDPTVDEPTEITLTGTGTASDIGLNESAIGFGTIQPDSTQVESLELTNDGSEPVEITGSSVTGSESSAVSVTGLQQRILQPGDSEPFDIEVVTTGLDRGSLSAQVRISTADETVASSIGATVASPELTVRGTPNAEAFGTTRVGDTTTAGVDIENTGNADLDLTDITTTGTDAAAFSVVEQPAEPISSQSSDQLVVEFDPEALPNAAERAQNTPLGASATLEIDHNAGSTQSVDLTAEAETAALTTPRTFQFGETPIGTTTTRELTIENTPSATTDITVTGVELSGSDAAEYGAILTEGEPPVTLTPGEETTVNVSLTPGSFDRKFATLSIQTEDPRQPAQKVGLSNAETVYTVEYGSVNVQYINPTSGQEPIVDVDRGLRGQNATVTSTTSDVDRTADYELDYEFGTTAAEAGGQTALNAETPVQYINATTTAQAREFNDSTIQIEVSKAVLASQNATPENVTIYHESGTGYEALETTRLFETRQGQVYEVTTDSYSLFAVGVEPSDDDEGGDGDDDDSSDGDDGDSDGSNGDDGDDSDSGSSGGGAGGGGGGGGVPPSATDGTGVDVPNISSDLGEQATITAESEPIITEQNETRSTATFADNFPLLRSVTFVKAGPFADDIEGTVNARAIDGDPVATGTPDGSTVSIAHVTIPDQNMSQVELRYVIPESRLSEIGASADEVTAYRFDESSWQDVDVEVTEETETGTVLTAELSNPITTYVALTAPAAEGDATDEEMSDQSDDSTGTASDDSIPGFGMIAALLAIIAVIVVLSRRR